MTEQVDEIAKSHAWMVFPSEKYKCKFLYLTP